MYKSKTNTDQCHKPSNQSIVPFDPNDGMYFNKKKINQYKSIFTVSTFLCVGKYPTIFMQCF